MNIILRKTRILEFLFYFLCHLEEEDYFREAEALASVSVDALEQLLQLLGSRYDFLIICDFL